MPSRKLSDLHPVLLPLCQKFLADCKAAGIKAGISQTYRSAADQDAAYAKGRTAPGKKITNAKGGESPHNCTKDGSPAALAFDFFVYNDDGKTPNWNVLDDEWKKAVAIGEALGLVSGARWHSIKDFAHMEIKDWRKV